MIAALYLTLLTVPSALPVSSSAYSVAAPQDPELDAKIAAAGKDVAKLLALATAASSAGQEEDAKKIYRKVIEIDAGNEAARRGLRHQFYDNKWFESFAELSKYKREEDARMKAKGLARYKDQWVPEGDVPFLSMNWTKDAQGVWVNPVEAARAKQIAEWQAAGYVFRADDNSWVSPDDQAKWAAIQWKCGEEWVDTAKANEYHSKIGQWWQLAGENFVVWTTCDWDTGNLARWHADKVRADLERLFGLAPVTKPHLITLNSLAQYNQVSGGNPPVIPESEGISSLHGAYFADAYFDVTAKPPQFLGAGVSYWDRKDPKTDGWGPFWLRWAAAQSYIEAIDPSWMTIGERIASGGGNDAAQNPAPFWNEKKIPRWLRYGAASYVERFMKNPMAAEGANPWDLREFACSEVKKAGGLRKLDQIFAFVLDLNDIQGSSRLYEEAGLVVAFLLDGGNKDVAAKHDAFKSALKSGKKTAVTEAAKALQDALVQAEPELKKFAGL
ncbi:MAG: hypothetical protein ACKVWV_09995 [Planctomycetota bacterium]